MGRSETNSVTPASNGKEDELLVVKRRLAEAEATIAALLAGQIDAVIDTGSHGLCPPCARYYYRDLSE